MSDINDARREYAALREQQEYFRGRVDAALDDALADPEQIEVLRAMAWHRAGHRVSLGKDAALTGMPDGWPEGVDREQFVADWANGQREKFLGASTEAPPPSSASPGVSRFREKVGS